MKLKTLAVSLLLGLAASPAFAADQYLVRVPANVNLSPAAPETPQEPISLSLSAEALPAAMVNEPYSFNLLDRLTITGGSGSHNYSDTAWSLKAGDALPPGLSLSGSMIAGTPTTKNETGMDFEVIAQYEDAQSRQVYRISIGEVAIEITGIAAGYNHACAVTATGGVKCWGDNYYSQLGDGTRTDSSLPVDVQGLPEKIISVSAGTQATCAIGESGKVICWGRGLYTGSASASTYTGPIYANNLSGVTKLSFLSSHACALQENSELKCWGNNGDNQISPLSIPNIIDPVAIPDAGGQVVDITAGGQHTCVRLLSGKAKCWGGNNNGQLGDNTFNDKSAPTEVLNLNDVQSISAGNNFTCAIANGGKLYCWGAGGAGQLGIGVSASKPIPQLVAFEGAAQISTGNYSGCTITTSNQLYCWGNRLPSRPTIMPNIQADVEMVSMGGNVYCAKDAETMKCWGQNTEGQLGVGESYTRSDTPVKVKF